MEAWSTESDELPRNSAKKPRGSGGLVFALGTSVDGAVGKGSKIVASQHAPRNRSLILC